MSTTEGHKLQTPLLRWLSAFYGHLGVQLSPISMKSISSLLTFTLNLAIIGLMHYALFTLDCFNLQAVSMKVSRDKPFFRLLVDFIFTYGFPLFSFTKMLYYMVVGRRMVRLLDSLLFWRTLQQQQKMLYRRTELLIYFAVISLNCANFVLSYTEAIVAFIYSPTKDVVEVVKLLTNFLCSMLSFLELQILHYYQWVTRNCLRSVERTLDGVVQNAGKVSSFKLKFFK